MLLRWLTYSGIAVRPVPRATPLHETPSLTDGEHAPTQWLAYVVKQSTFVRNLPFHLFPPDLPAQLARLPHAVESPAAAVLEAFTAHAAPSVAPSERLAYCEDAIHLPRSDLVLLSCDPGRKRWNTVMGPLADPHAAQGALWVVDPLAHEQDAVAKVQLEWADLEPGEVEFHPLGVEVYHDEEGDDDVRLFVVNNRAKLSTIEVFALLATSSSSIARRAKHLFTLSHPSFTGAPNSIAPLSRTSFLLSHDHHYTRRTSNPFGKLANFVETVNALPYGRVDFVSFDEPNGDDDEGAVVRTSTTVASGISFANGLALSPAKDTLVVASTTRRELLFYDVTLAASSSSPPTLALRRTVSVPMLVDNLSLLPSPSGGLTVVAAGHPSYPALLSAAHGLNLRLRLPGPLREWAHTLGHREWEEWDVSWRNDEQRGMSWAVVVRDPGPEAAKEANEGPAQEWETVYQSNGRIAEGGFGGSTTAVAGTSEVEGKKRAWMVVAGLYEEGVRIVRE